MYSKTVLIGNLGENVELKHTATGTPVCNLSVATSTNWMKDGQKQSRTTWHKVTVWNKQAENCAKYLAKGSKVFVEGMIEKQEYEKDGVKMHTTVIKANDVKFLSSNSEINSALKGADPGSANVSTDVNFASDDIPF